MLGIRDARNPESVALTRTAGGGAGVLPAHPVLRPLRHPVGLRHLPSLAGLVYRAIVRTWGVAALGSVYLLRHAVLRQPHGAAFLSPGSCGDPAEELDRRRTLALLARTADGRARISGRCVHLLAAAPSEPGTGDGRSGRDHLPTGRLHGFAGGAPGRGGCGGMAAAGLAVRDFARRAVPVAVVCRIGLRAGDVASGGIPRDHGGGLHFVLSVGCHIDGAAPGIAAGAGTRGDRGGVGRTAGRDTSLPDAAALAPERGAISQSLSEDRRRHAAAGSGRVGAAQSLRDFPVRWRDLEASLGSDLSLYLLRNSGAGVCGVSGRVSQEPVRGRRRFADAVRGAVDAGRLHAGWENCLRVAAGRREEFVVCGICAVRIFTRYGRPGGVGCAAGPQWTPALGAGGRGHDRGVGPDRRQFGTALQHGG